MTQDTKRNEYVTRDAILKLLSDEEIGRVSALEAGPPLVEGDEYLDLLHLDEGVRQVHPTTKVAIHQVLPRSAVRDETWTKICSRLGSL